MYRVGPLGTRPTLIHADNFSAGIAVFGEHAVEAGQAVGAPLPHDVPLAPELAVALEAGEVQHVPGPALGLRALVREDDLQKMSHIVKVKKF
jgi:hypothetical protein